MPKGLDELFQDLPTRLEPKQLAQLLELDHQVVYRWLQTGAIPGYKVGGTWIVLRDEVKEALKATHNQGGEGKSLKTGSSSES